MNYKSPEGRSYVFPGDNRHSTDPHIDSITGLSTAPIRGMDMADIIEQKLLPFITEKRKILGLDIGLGLDSGWMQQPFEPYVLAARINQMNIEYGMILVDRDSRPIKHLQRETYMFLSQSDYELYKPFRQWDRYLQVANIQDEVVHLNASELRRLFRGPSYISDSGFRKAAIPAGFREKIISGDIQFVQDNIATVDLSSYGPFDWIACTNVLYMLPEWAQEKAIANMTGLLRDETSILFLDDMRPRRELVSVPLLQSFGGWLDPQIAASRFGLTFKTWEESKNYHSVVLAKQTTEM